MKSIAVVYNAERPRRSSRIPAIGINVVEYGANIVGCNFDLVMFIDPPLCPEDVKWMNEEIPARLAPAAQVLRRW